MKIIIVGIGKVGYAIAEQMTGENHDLVVIDRNSAVLDHVDSMLDVMCVEGNGASASVLLEAGVREADLLIAVSENDEVNLICCLMAKKLGAKHTVARVRNPEYFRDAPILRREIGLDMIINPENAAAQEISRILRVPSAFSVETFARGLVELIGFQTEEGDSLVGKSLIDYNRENPNSILMCAAKRGEEVIVPNGSFVPQTGDRVYVIGTPAETTRVLRSMGRAMAPIRRVSILGGSRIAQYLAWVLTDIGTHVTIVEKDEAKCLTLAEKLPKVTVIHGDGTNHDLLESEGIFHCDAFIAVTDRDEENLLMALTAKRYGVKKVVPKMSRMGYLDIVNLTGLDTVISPKAIIASQISSYVRGLANSQGSAVESLHYILGGAIEAVEFTATSATHFLDRPLSDLHFRNGLLVAAIVHNGRMEIPNGHSQIHAGDRVIVVAKKLFLQDLYAALHAPGEIVVFEHYESCCPSFLKTLSDLAVRGSAPLSSRYIVNRDGILVDAGTALAPGAVSRLDPCGKYLIFFSNKGRAAMADKFGASMVSALGDVCETTAYQRADLAALAAQQLNALAQKVTARLGLTLAAGADVRDYVAAQCTPQKGAAGLSGCCDRIFRALSEPPPGPGRARASFPQQERLLPPGPVSGWG